MKKLQLKIQDLTNPSILTHREIKNIMGGEETGSGGDHCTITCTKDDGSTKSIWVVKCDTDEVSLGKCNIWDTYKSASCQC